MACPSMFGRGPTSGSRCSTLVTPTHASPGDLAEGGVHRMREVSDEDGGLMLHNGKHIVAALKEVEAHLNEAVEKGEDPHVLGGSS